MLILSKKESMKEEVNNDYSSLFPDIFSCLLQDISEIESQILADQHTTKAFLSLYNMEKIDSSLEKALYNNSFLRLINLCVSTVHFLSKLSFNFLRDQAYQIEKSEYEHSKHINILLFSNDYVKCYKAFAGSCAYMNDLLGNVNIVMNHIECNITKKVGLESSKIKFTMIRYLIKQWFCEVTKPLESEIIDCISYLNTRRLKEKLKDIVPSASKEEIFSDDPATEIVSPADEEFILRELINCLLDSSCSSHQVFRLNQLKFQGSSTYAKLEKRLCDDYFVFYKKYFEQNLSSFHQNILSNDNLLNDFMIPSSKRLIYSSLCDNISSDAYSSGNEYVEKSLLCLKGYLCDVSILEKDFILLKELKRRNIMIAGLSESDNLFLCDLSLSRKHNLEKNDANIKEDNTSCHNI